MRVTARPLNVAAHGPEAASNGPATPVRLIRKVSDVDVESRSRVGRRAEQAARERAIAFRVMATVGALVVVGLAICSAVTLASPFFAAPSHASTSVAVARPSAVGVASRRVKAAMARGDLHGSGAHGGSAVPEIRARYVPPAPSPAVAPSKQHAYATPRTPAQTASASTPKSATVRTAAKQAAHVRSIAKSAGGAGAALAAASVAAHRGHGTITVETFGYDFGPAPAGSKFVADVRNIDAGDFAQSENGLMASVRARVMATSAAQMWLSVMETQWEPALKNGDKIAIGCARGHHRSVTLGFLLAAHLRAQGYTVNFVNRDIARTW